MRVQIDNETWVVEPYEYGWQVWRCSDVRRGKFAGTARKADMTYHPNLSEAASKLAEVGWARAFEITSAWDDAQIAMQTILKVASDSFESVSSGENGKHGV